VLARKAANDAAAFIGELARLRGRNEAWGDQAVRRAASIGSSEAVHIDAVDGIASSLEDLLRGIDDEVVEVADGRSVTLETWDEDRGVPAVTVRFQHTNPLQQLLHAVTSPEVAFFLLLVGLFGIIFEVYNPGIGLAGILGAVCLLLGFYALSILPTNWVGVLLVVGAVILFVLDLQTAGFGVWTLGGVVALVAGGSLVFSGAAPALSLSPFAVGAGVIATLVFFASVMTAALRVRLRRPITGEDSLVGVVGEATTDIAPEGTVLTKGTLWRARTMETGISAGSRVQVKATEGFVLLVEPFHDNQSSAPA
nr:nodulation protein NfeD [Actinomycetota bacterium]